MPVVSSVMLRLGKRSRWQVCGVCVWLTGSVAVAGFCGRELPLSGVAADARGHDSSLRGCQRKCECGVTLGVTQWELQAGVCARERRLYTNRARYGPSQSLDVLLFPRVPRPMPDGYGRIRNHFILILQPAHTMHNTPAHNLLIPRTTFQQKPIRSAHVDKDKDIEVRPWVQAILKAVMHNQQTRYC